MTCNELLNGLINESMEKTLSSRDLVPPFIENVHLLAAENLINIANGYYWSAKSTKM